MQFKMTPEPTFVEAVTIPPGNKRVLQVRFKHKDEAAFKAFHAEIMKFPSDVDALLDIVDGWEQADTEFSRENLGLLLATYPGAATAIFRKYREAMIGIAEKN